MRYRFTKNDISIRNNYDGSFSLSIMLDGQYVDRLYIGYSKDAALRKFQREFGLYPKDYKPAGVLCLNNFGGTAVMEIEYGIDDYAYVCDHYDDGYTNLTKNKIYYNENGESYFIRKGRKWFLSDFMRCSIGKTEKPIYYTDQIYGGHFTYDEMVEDARKNYDYGDPTNYLTYVKDWWKEYYKVVS